MIGPVSTSTGGNSGVTPAPVISRTGRVMPTGIRFPPGVSGNPNGRPKTAQVRKALLAHLEEAIKDAKGKKNGKTYLLAMVESIVAEARGGEHGVQAFTSI